MKPLSTPRGTADILPAQISRWAELESFSRTIFALYGYREIRTPVFEDRSLFKRSLGETTEVVNKQLLEVKSQRSDSEEAGLALRPEGTAAVVRAYNQNGWERSEGLAKLFYVGPMFRGERPQKGRLRQFHQVGAEALGYQGHNPLLDAEMIALAAQLLKAFGLKNYRLQINSLGSAEDKAGFAAWLRTALHDKIGSLSVECQAQYERNVFRLLDSKDPECQQVLSGLDIGTRHLSPKGLLYFQQVCAALDIAGVSYEVAPRLVRGLDYYTHTVFEFLYDGLGAQNAIGAGGRYNGLVEQLGGGDRRMAPEQVGAIGFALGLERILLALEAEGQSVVAERAITAFVVYQETAEQDMPQAAFRLVQELRTAGVACDMYFGRNNKMKQQFTQAEKMGARFVLVLGEEELRSGSIGVKDMKTGQQVAVAAGDIINYLERS